MPAFEEDGFDKYNPDMPDWIKKMIEKGGTLTGRMKTDLFGLDFSKIESRTVAYIVGVRGGKTVILEQLKPEQLYSGYSADLMIIDEINEYVDISKMPDPTVEVKEKPVKQNGRSASYLQHDRTKQHKLKKPVKRRR